MTDKRWIQLGGLAGIIYVAASLVGEFIAPSSPNLNASIATITAYFTGHRHAVMAGQIIMAGGFAFALWWLGTLGHTFGKLGERRDPLGWIAVTAGVASATLALVSNSPMTLLAILAAQPNGLANGPVVRAVFDLPPIFGGVSLVLFAAFASSLGIGAARRGMVGSWLGWLGFVVGIAAGVGGGAQLALGGPSAMNTVYTAGLIGFAIVVLILSVQMLRGRTAIGPKGNEGEFVPSELG